MLCIGLPLHESGDSPGLNEVHGSFKYIMVFARHCYIKKKALEIKAVQYCFDVFLTYRIKSIMKLYQSWNKHMLAYAMLLTPLNN